jgi:hypothetical protein
MATTDADADQRKLLRIYLNDHLTVDTGIVQLAKRAVGSNAGTAFHAPLVGLLEEISDDRAALLAVMAHLGVPVDRLKTTAAVVGERFGRFKLNGRLTGYSPLSRVVELEGLQMATVWKLRLWQALAHARIRTPDGVDLTELAARAESQLERLGALHRDAAAEAFGRGAATP